MCRILSLLFALSFLCVKSSLFPNRLLANSAKTIEITAGLVPFKVYMKGAVRLYYREDSKIKGLVYYDNKGLEYASQEWIYDSKGMVTTKNLLETIGWLTFRESYWNYLYGANNQILEEKQVVWLENRTLKYKYDNQGRVLSIQAYDKEFFTQKTESVEKRYTEQGLAESSFFDSHGKKICSRHWTYDQYGRQNLFALFDSENNLLSGSRMVYEPSYGSDLEILFDADQKTSHHKYTFYNELGLVKESSLCDPDDRVQNRLEREYNDLQQLHKIREYDSEERLVGELSLLYDRYGRLYRCNFDYQDPALFRERIEEYLHLGGNDLNRTKG